MKTTILIFLTLAVSAAIARPSSESDEYDNNLVDSIPLEDDQVDEQTDYIQM
jgi:hypothetical protein